MMSFYWLLWFCLVSNALSLSDINIGGLFNQFNESKLPDYQGSQHIAAFIMAINEINNKTDGINENLLADYQIKYRIDEAHGFTGAVKAADMMDASNPSPIAVIGSMEDDEAIAVTDMLETVQTVLISTRSTSSELSKGRDFPYKVKQD